VAIDALGRSEITAESDVTEGVDEAGIPFLTLASLLVLAVVAIAGLTFRGGSATSVREPSPAPNVAAAPDAPARPAYQVYLVDSEELAREVWAAEARTALLWELTAAVPGHDFEVVDVSTPNGRARWEHFKQLVLSGAGESLVLIDAHERLEH
jgi:hypothetical protein